MVTVDNGGLRFNEEKPRVDLIPPEVIFSLGTTLSAGAKKYAERNWERGMNWSNTFASLVRHTWKFWRGEEVDEETGCLHVDLILVNAAFLVTYVHRGIGKDDRHIVVQK